MPETAAVFVGSTVEGLEYARALQWHFQYDESIRAEVWPEVFDQPMLSTAEQLDLIKDFDFAVFVMTADDELVSRGNRFSVPRDNLIYELGIAVSAMGRERVFPLQPYGVDLRFPSDLHGTNPLHFRAVVDEKGVTATDARAGIGPAASTIREIIGRLGIRSETPSKEPIPVAPTETLGSIGGLIANGQGTGLGGVKVNLRSLDDQDSPVVATTTSDNLGAFHFSALPTGTYVVEAVSPPHALVFRELGSDGHVSNSAEVEVTRERPHVGSTDGEIWPSWDYEARSARSLGPVDFVFLFSTSTIVGQVRGGSSDGLRVTAQLAGHSHPSPHVLSLRTGPDGRFAFQSLLEGLYTLILAHPSIDQLQGKFDIVKAEESSGGTLIVKNCLASGHNSVAHVDFEPPPSWR